MTCTGLYNYIPYYGQMSLEQWIMQNQMQMQNATLEMQLNSLRQCLNYNVTEIYGGWETNPIGYTYTTPLTKTNCVNCGAPLKNHICEYCGTNNICTFEK